MSRNGRINVSGKFISLHRRSVFDSGTSVSVRGLRRIFGKISQKSEPSADFTRFGNFHFFNFSTLVTPDLIIYVSPHETPDRSMPICSMGPGDLITHVDPK